MPPSPQCPTSVQVNENNFVLYTCNFMGDLRVDIYGRAHQQGILSLQEMVKPQEKKRREPKMQFNTQFQAHYLSLSIKLAMVQKVAHNSLKC